MRLRLIMKADFLIPPMKGLKYINESRCLNHTNEVIKMTRD